MFEPFIGLKTWFSREAMTSEKQYVFGVWTQIIFDKTSGNGS